VEEVFHLLREMNWLYFLAALLLLLSGSLVRAYRWGSLVWALGVPVAYWRLVALYFVGAFFGLFLPTGVGGDAVKMYELSRADHRTAPAISSVLMDRFLGLFVLFALALLALVFGHELVALQIRILIAMIFIGCLIGAALLLQRTWLETVGRRLGLHRLLGRIKILRELYESIYLYGSAVLLRALAASLVWNLVLILGYYFLSMAVGIDLSLWYYFLFVPIISALMLIPSLGGLGIREGGTVLLFTQVGISESHSLAMALAYDIYLLTNSFIGAMLYLAQGVREARQE
jgi:uncharacterized protein (TIRG00374 family)